uniref:Uncharacterized protein n=1 Tax=Quercus lobata TaxID=97700 RepID=A0A7N2LKL3_QUELO
MLKHCRWRRSRGLSVAVCTDHDASGDPSPPTTTGDASIRVMVQVRFQRVRDHKLTKPEMGHLQKAGAIPMRHLQEFHLVSMDGFKANQRLVFDDLFKEGDLVDVAGTTNGKGFQVSRDS